MLGLLVVGALITYGMAVRLENHVLKVGQNNRNLTEENQDLQLALDRIQSYHNIATVSAHLQGLQSAREMVTIPVSGHLTPSAMGQPKVAIPEGVYGF
jgi:hypothetical protein